jgi:hypothetical protein
METREVTVSFVVRTHGQVAVRVFDIEWIEIDSAEAIADTIKDAILSIE